MLATNFLTTSNSNLESSDQNCRKSKGRHALWEFNAGAAPGFSLMCLYCLCNAVPRAILVHEPKSEHKKRNPTYKSHKTRQEAGVLRSWTSIIYPT